jgi:hypothetical protein
MQQAATKNQRQKIRIAEKILPFWKTLPSLPLPRLPSFARRNLSYATYRRVFRTECFQLTADSKSIGKKSRLG